MVNGMVILELEHRPNGIHIPAQDAAGKTKSRVNVLSAVRGPVVVHGIIEVGGHDLALGDAAQGVRSHESAKVDGLKIGLRRQAESLHAALSIGVSQSHPGKTAAQRIAGEHREPGRVLLKVLKQGLRVRGLRKSVRIQAAVISCKPRLIVLVVTLEDGEPGGNGSVKNVRLGKSKGVELIESSPLELKTQRLTQPEEIVGGIVHAHKIARQSAHAPREANGVSPFFLN